MCHFISLRLRVHISPHLLSVSSFQYHLTLLAFWFAFHFAILFSLPALCFISKPSLSWLCGDVPFWPVALLRWQRRRKREWARHRETKRDWERTAWRRPRPHAFCGQAEGLHWHSSHAGTLQAWGFCSTTLTQHEHIIHVNISACFKKTINKDGSQKVNYA